jgi:prophage antirepressor-like protein
VCAVLGIKQATRTIENFPDDEVLKLAVNTTHSQKNHTGKGGAQYRLYVNEPGLYRLIFQSRKPEAERFKRWIFHEVLPSIRKTGRYDLADYSREAREAMSRMADVRKELPSPERPGIGRNLAGASKNLAGAVLDLVCANDELVIKLDSMERADGRI